MSVKELALSPKNWKNFEETQKKEIRMEKFYILFLQEERLVFSAVIFEFLFTLFQGF